MTAGRPVQDLAELPAPWPESCLESIRGANDESTRCIVVLDDDPTGTQTVHGITVLTSWDRASLAAEVAFAEEPACSGCEQPIYQMGAQEAVAAGDQDPGPRHGRLIVDHRPWCESFA